MSVVHGDGFDIDRCDAMVWSDYSHYRCDNRAKVHVGDKGYCGRHDPAKKAAREAQHREGLKLRIALYRANDLVEAAKAKVIKLAKDQYMIPYVIDNKLNDAVAALIEAETRHTAAFKAYEEAGRRKHGR